MDPPSTGARANADVAQVEGLGDPFDLDCNRDYMPRLEKQFRDQQDMAPIIASFRQHYLFTTDDQRVVRVYNMPAFSAFVGASVAVMRCLQREINLREYAARSGARALIGAATKCLKRPQLENELRTIGKLFGSTSNNQTITAIMGVLSRHFVEAATQHQTQNSGITRYSVFLGISIVLNLEPLLLTDDELLRQRLRNASLLLSAVWSCMANNHDTIIESNVLIAALDERQFFTWNIWSPLSRDDGIWFRFRHMSLPRAPTLMEYDPTLCAKLAEFTELFHA